MFSPRRSLAALLVATLGVTSLSLVAAVPASASTNGSGVVITEVSGSSANTYGAAYVELFNPTDGDVSLTGYRLAYGSATRAANANVNGINLTGTVTAHHFFLVQLSTATSATLPTPDQKGAISASGSNGLFILQNTTATLAPGTGNIAGLTGVVDALGYGSANTFEGHNQGTSLSASTAAKRTFANGAPVDTDDNAADFTVGALDPQNSSVQSSPGGSALALGAVSAKTGTVGSPITTFSLSATGGTAPYSYSVSGLPNGVTANAAGQISGTPSDAGTSTVTATVTDAASASAQGTFTFTVSAASSGSADHVVISEVWADGGFTGSAWRNSYFELYNPTASSVDLSTYNIGYGAYNRTAGTPVPSTALSGSIPSHGYYLIAAASLGSAGVDLPTPDATTTLNPDYRDGLVVLWTGTTAPAPAIGDITGEEAADHIVDAVGYGTGNTFEGAKMPANTSQAQGASRTPVAADTNNGSVDFALAAPSPTNSAGDTFPQLKLAPLTSQSVIVNTPVSFPSLAATGGQSPVTYAYSLTGGPTGITVDASTGVVSGQTSQLGTFHATAAVSDGHGHTASQPVDITSGTFGVTNPGDQVFDTSTPVDLALTTTPANGSYSYAQTGGTLPAGLSLDATSGHITGTPTTTQSAASITITVTNLADSTTLPVTFSITVTADVLSIATVQGTGDRSPYAGTGTAQGADTITTQGVVTAVWKAGYSGTGTSATLGTANAGLSGFVIQTPGAPTTTGSDAIFVYNSSFTGVDKNGTAIAVGQSVKVSGKVSEYKAASSKSAESETEFNVTTATTTVLTVSLGTVVPQTTLPATYAEREAHEFEAFTPTDAVITDTYQYETDGELGVASGSRPLVQPTEICADNDTTCLANAQTDIINRGYFLGDGTNTFFTSASTHYAPNKSGNSAIPLPYMDATHSVRVGAAIQVPTGHALILGFWPDLSSTSATRAGKWYLQPERAVLGTPGTATTQGTPDLGSDVIGFENTRATNAAPDQSNIDKNAASNLKIATFNVENYFTETGEAFAAANPAIGNSPDGTTSSTTAGCQYDTDRTGRRELVYQCVTPYGQAIAWDPVSGAPTAYKAGLANAPRGAATAADLDRQTAKIVTAINGLGADIVSLEEIENPNKLKEGVTNSPLSPDLSNLKDQGQGTAIANRDAALGYLVEKLNEKAGSEVWAYVKSPEEATDATSMVHLCSVLRGDGVTPIDGNAAAVANASCSYASMQDVIRSAFIYKKAKVVPVGSADLDFPANPLSPDNAGNLADRSYNGASPFDMAREPLAQYFKPVGYPNSDGFAVIVNHFKSKGGTSTDDDPNITITGDNVSDPLVGAYNAARTAEAKELVRFANQFAAKWNTDKVLMLGDFNSYTKEDPVQAVLNDSNVDGGLHFSLLESSDAEDLTYNYTSNVTVNGDTVSYGTVGSIDHEFASAGFLSMVTGADVWEINANETDAYDYGRYNTNATNFYYGTTVPATPTYADDLAAATPFRSSDHNPMVMGIRLPALADSAAARVTDVQIVGVNDFHGRLVADSADGGAAALGGAVDELRDQYGAGNTIFASGGDNVGASTFESFTQNDKPSLDALTAMNLQVSTVGNHEFDKGWKDIIERLDAPYDATANPYGADGGTSWGDYLAANVVYTTDTSDPDYDAAKAGKPITTATKQFTIQNPLNPGVPIKVGFIGTVTPDLASLESPANLAGVHVQNEAETIATINSYAAQLKADGDQIVVVLTHEGAASVDCSTMLTSGSSFAQELNGMSDDVDAVLSGHTHLEYSCSFPVAGWAGRAITSRPVMQAGSYAVALDQLVYSFNADSQPVEVTSNLVGVKGPVSALFSAPDDPAVKSVVDAAVAAAAGPGATVLGKLGGPFDRARLSDGTENRGGESTLGNQIAEIQRSATDADIAFMNPGGLRADLDGTNGNLTYRQAADVQPFANELTSMTLTGAQIKKVLEEQWSRDNIDNAHANIPARPFLKLGISQGFTYTYHEVPDPVHAGATLGVVDAMWLNGSSISLTASYTVTVNSFLSTGGDNFWELANGANIHDTEQTDLQAQVEYMQQYTTDPLPVDYSQRGVRVTFPSNAPTTYHAGDHVVFDLSSLDMTGPSDVTDGTLAVKLGTTELGTVTVTHLNSTQPYDDRGNAHVDVTLPEGIAGPQTLTITGATTSTRVLVPLAVPNGTIVAATPTISGTPQVGQTLTADASGFTPADVDLTYVWKAGDDVIAGATGATLVLAAAQLGKAITVTVTGTKSGYDPDSATSSPTSAVAEGSLSSTPAPTISDTSPVVGQRLTASAGAWDAGVTVTFEWFVGGAPVRAGSSYTVVPADLGKVITVRATGTKTAYLPTTVPSAPTSRVVAATLSRTPTPRISDTTPKVGERLAVSVGTWDPGVRISVQWYVSGRPVAGATASTYLVRGSDYRDVITVRVVGSKAGYTTVTRWSSPTARVAAGTLSKTPTPKISDSTPRVRQRITVKVGTWDDGVHTTVQWYVNGKKVAHATHATFTVRPSDRGKKITVRVTGAKSGYISETVTSRSTARVAR